MDLTAAPPCFVAPALYVTEIGSPTHVGIVLAAAAIPLLAFHWRPLDPMRGFVCCLPWPAVSAGQRRLLGL